MLNLFRNMNKFLIYLLVFLILIYISIAIVVVIFINTNDNRKIESENVEISEIDKPIEIYTTEVPESAESTKSVDSVKYIVAIDAGHQSKGDYEHEPIGPGALETKAKVSSGTQGAASKVPEYQLTLAVALLLRDELVARGYEVFMIRETHDINISNKERAEMASEVGADIFIRIHADGSQNSATRGILTLSPTKNNPYVSELYEASYALSELVLNAMVDRTGANNRGILQVDNMSGINWATMPVTIVEIGLMTNLEEDMMMQTAEYQQLLVEGIANGIDEYFLKEEDESKNLIENEEINNVLD